jgi:anti-anti-sigma factor
MKCIVAIHRIESGFLLRLSGRGTLHDSPAVRDFVCGIIKEGAQIVLDLSECEYLDSTFLGCLMVLHERSSNRPGSFAVLANETARRKLLRTVRLDRLLTFIDECPVSIGEPVILRSSELKRTDFCRHLLETHRKLSELGGPEAATFGSIADEFAKELNRGTA